jgi:hypothetical protein
VEALKLTPGEEVLLKPDPRVFSAMIAPLQNLIQAAGAHVSTLPSDGDGDTLRQLFDNADVFIWLPEIQQGNSPALQSAINEWLDARRGRALHFHWQSGSYPIGFHELPPQEFIDRTYLAALDVSPQEIERKHQRAIRLLRAGPVRVTTPEGTDISFEVRDRPFCSQTGDASRERMKSARIRIDRDVELPAGVLRVAPIEESANGSIFVPLWRPIAAQGRNLFLHIIKGHVTIQGVNADKIDQELTAAGGDARMFREFALGFNPALKVVPEFPFIAYYGYGSGVVRLSLGDNEEMGGLNRGGGVFWNFIHNATVTAGGQTLVKDGKLTAAVDT